MKALFVCVHNAGRSQMAQAFAEREGIYARSAGSRPGDQVHPNVVEAMMEAGIDLSECRPSKLTQDDANWADVVVTMGCNDACPIVPSADYLNWDLPDPRGLPIDEVRAIRDEIERRVKELNC